MLVKHYVLSFIQLWNNFVPSLAGVVLLLQMKFIYNQMQVKLKKHYDYVAVTETLETR